MQNENASQVPKVNLLWCQRNEETPMKHLKS